MTQPVWRKSSHSGDQDSTCVEVAPLGATVAIRDSTDPDGPRLHVSAAAWSDLLATVRSNP